MQEEKLLHKIYQGANMGLYSIETIMPKISDQSATAELSAYQHQLENIACSARQMMDLKGIDYKEQDTITKMGVWAGIQWNSLVDGSISHIADMVIQGDTMGITELVGVINHSPMADSSVRALGEQLVEAQRRNIEIMKHYL